MSTGVSVTDDVIEAFNNFKLKREPHKVRYFTYKVSDDKKFIEMDSMGALDKTYEDFCEALPDNDCRYGLIDLEFQTDDGRPTSKIVFIAWNPDDAPIRSKMLYSGSKEALKRVLVGVGIHLNATDSSELDYETSILPAVKKFT
ncbi:hypothetical protein TrCOL_g9950 [Triparma columacea]|uniref:ADF-H domain-containing protein n=1 Tax=Triparma columacea TaxID=722753 RepID=A0A9W7FV40_9STRA|nr:hypothetical protein TrCOL_g9950 [Triparma columacea]